MLKVVESNGKVAPAQRERDLMRNPNFSLSFIAKEAGPEASRQIKDPFAEYYSAGRVIAPVLSLDKLWAMYEQNAVHSACCNAKADDAMGSGWKLTPEDDQSEASTAEAEQSVRDRLEGVARDLTFMSLLRQAFIETEAMGFGAWEVVRDKPRGSILAIYPVAAQSLRICCDPKAYDSDEEYYMQIVGGLTRYFIAFGSEKVMSATLGPLAQPKGDDPKDVASEILCFKQYSPSSPYYGYPRWSSAIPAIAEFNAIREYNLSFFSGSGQTDRIIFVRAAQLQEAQRVITELQEQIKEAKGFAHVSLMSGGTSDLEVMVHDLQPQGIPREAGFVRRREDIIKEILIAHQVPPYRVGWAELGSLGGSAAKEMLRAYRIGSVEPLQAIFESKLNRDLFGEKGFALSGFSFEFVDIDWDKEAENLERAIKSSTEGLVTINEAREIMGLPTGDDPILDKHYVNGVELGTILPPGQEAAPAPGGGALPAAARAGRPSAPVIELTHGQEGGDEAERVLATNQARAAEKKRSPHYRAQKKRAAAVFDAERKAVVEAVRRADTPEDAEKAAEEALKKKDGKPSSRTST